MAGRGLIFVVGTSLLSLQAQEALGEPIPQGQPSTTNHVAKRVDCLEVMNLTRTEVGLEKFRKPEKTEDLLPIVETSSTGSSAPQQSTRTASGGSGLTAAEKAQADFLNKFCLALSQSPSTNANQNSGNGTYMYSPESSDTEGDCTAAVDYWRGAVSNFSSLPPVYSATDPLYNDSRNVSLMGLFNPEATPTLDCAFITCNPTSASEKLEEDSLTPPKEPALQTPDPANGDKTELAGDQGPSRRLDALKTPTYSLLCLSKPKALEDSQAPFTQEQWDKILGVENNASQPKVAGVLALAAAYLVSLFL